MSDLTPIAEYRILSRGGPEHVIYALVHPITQQVFYVGKTNDPQGRLRAHVLQQPEFRDLLSSPETYEFKMLILERTQDSESLTRMETRWVMYFLNEGCELTNKTFPCKPTEQQRLQLIEICERYGWEYAGATYLPEYNRGTDER